MKRLSLIFLAVAFLASTTIAQNGLYRYKLNQPYKYITEYKSDLIQEAMGQTMNITVEGTCNYVLTVSNILSNGDMQMTMRIENALIIVESPQGTQSFGNELSGKEFEFVLTPSGKIVEKDTAMKKLPNEQSQIISQIFQMFPPLEVDKVAEGGTWEVKKTDTSGVGENKVFSKTKSIFEVKGKRTVKETDCTRIEFKSETELAGKVSRGGMDLQISGEKETDGAIHYDPAAGIIVEVITEGKGDQIISDPNMPSMKMNMTMSVTGKIEYVP